MLSIKRDVASVWCSWTHRPKALSKYVKYMDAGFTTWDLADHYGPAEDFMESSDVNCLPPVAKMLYPTYKLSQSGYQGRLESQRSWSSRTLIFPSKGWGWKRLTWSSSIGGIPWSKLPGRTQVYVGTPVRGKIKHLGLTNDTEHLKIILETGIKIVSNQVQFSLIDRRPLVQMIQFCQDKGINFSPTAHSAAACCLRVSGTTRTTSGSAEHGIVG